MCSTDENATIGRKVKFTFNKGEFSGKISAANDYKIKEKNSVYTVKKMNFFDKLFAKLFKGQASS